MGTKSTLMTDHEVSNYVALFFHPSTAENRRQTQLRDKYWWDTDALANIDNHRPSPDEVEEVVFDKGVADSLFNRRQTVVTVN